MSEAPQPEHQHVASYPDLVERYRAEKDAYFKSAGGSPVPAAEREAFAGLSYYPVNEDAVVDELVLVPYTGHEPVSFTIATTDGKLRPAERAGVFQFEVLGGLHALTAYRLAGTDGVLDHDSLFVPFLDATSGTETYGAGRYLDVALEEDGTSTLDFNMAYHPSCVHDARFSCPLTPAENRLAIRLEAGVEAVRVRPAIGLEAGGDEARRSGARRRGDRADIHHRVHDWSRRHHLRRPALRAATMGPRGDRGR